MTTNKQKEKLKWDLINSAISGGLVFFGAFAATGIITFTGVCASLSAAIVVFLTKFQETLRVEDSKLKFFNFVG